jgi:hypothetical protein
VVPCHDPSPLRHPLPLLCCVLRVSSFKNGPG